MTLFITSIPLAVLIGLGWAAPSLAQSVEDVQFETGNFGTMVTGEITGHAYADYRLGAGAGQEMFIELTVTDTDGNGTVYFNVLPPGSEGEAIFIGSMQAEGNSALIELPEDGTYAIRTYLMGNDRDTGATVRYNLDLSIQ